MNEISRCATCEQEEGTQYHQGSLICEGCYTDVCDFWEQYNFEHSEMKESFEMYSARPYRGDY